MGRARIPAEWSTGRPSGPKWTAYRKVLIRRWYGTGRSCHYCAHLFAAPQLIEVCHLVSPIVAPGRAWAVDNLVPGHGSGRRRCPHVYAGGDGAEYGIADGITCGLACNYLAAIAPDAIKNAAGEDMPFTAQFMERQAQKRAQFSGNAISGQRKPAIPAVGPRKYPDVPAPLEHPIESTGREW